MFVHSYSVQNLCSYLRSEALNIKRQTIIVSDAFATCLWKVGLHLEKIQTNWKRWKLLFIMKIFDETNTEECEDGKFLYKKYLGHLYMRCGHYVRRLLK
jgi:hypothetical protein